MKTLIVIPARYASSRFPGKPLALIAGRAMLARVAVRARAAAEALADGRYVIATDDARIVEFCGANGLPCVMTEPSLPSGSDRALAAADALGADFEAVVNLQGDAPFTPVESILACVEALGLGDADVATPCVHLDWAGLDALREAKVRTPFSGTTCVFSEDGRAMWFSKTILPAIREEARLRAASPLSPVWKHVGLYAFRMEALRRFVSLPPSPQERLEGLEQLRLLENGMRVRCVPIPAPELPLGGVDTPEDLARLEALIAERRDPDAAYFA